MNFLDKGKIGTYWANTSSNGLVGKLIREGDADRYIITSNRESGFGRYDIMIEPKKKDDEAFIIEFKVFNPRREK